jgi:hypothetical protein
MICNLYVDPLWWVFLIIFASGLFGGMINSYTEDENLKSNELLFKDDKDGSKAKQHKWKIIRKNLTFGLGASFLVPLFLNMISSDLIDKIKGTGGEIGYSKLFVLASFCLVASIYSRAFISGVSRKVMDQIENANNNSNKALAIAEKNETVTAALIEQDVPTEILKSQNDITAEQKNILRSLINSPYSMRTLQGIIMDTKLDKSSIIDGLDGLAALEAITKGQSELGQIRWSITSYGRNLLAASA